MAADQSLLAIQNLKTFFYTSAGTIKAVDGVDFRLDPEGNPRGCGGVGFW